MYELIKLTERDYYIQSPAKIGLVLTGEDQAVLIDSGGDASAGKKVRNHLEAQRWTLRAVYNTHSHADHIGGNRYLQGQTGCDIFAPGLEYDFTRRPLLEPAFLYGGFPPAELRHKFLMAPESAVRELTPESLPEGWEVIPLPGHAFDMVGYRTADDTVYLADCLSSRETMEKYGIGFLVDVKAHLETLKKVKAMRARLFVPSHAEASESVESLAQLNIDRTLEIGERITESCREPKSFEQLLRSLFTAYGLAMTFEQHALVGSTVRSYLTWLTGEGRLRAFFEDNTLLWERI